MARATHGGDPTFLLAGAGTYEPRTVVRSDALDARYGRPVGTTAAFGLLERRYAAADETSSMMASTAAERALDDAGWRAGELDALIGACGVMEQPIPGTAPLVQQRLGLGDSGIPAFDVNATCLSFLPALDVALAGLAAGRWRRVLVFSADIATAALDHDDAESSAIFGDGAAAVALAADGPSRLLASRLETYGEHAASCRLEAGGTRLRLHDDPAAFAAASRFRMDGAALFRATARRFPPFLDRLLGEADVTVADLDSIIPHHASASALAHLRRSLGSDAHMVDRFATLGNRVASSLPHALAVAKAEGRLTQGSSSLLVGAAAGISLGGAVIRW